MKFSCLRENLSRSLSLVIGVAGKNVSLPILSNILIKVEEQKVSIISTNLELAVIATLRSKIEKTGSFTVPARTLTDFVNLLQDEKVELEVEENELSIVCGKSSTKIKGMPAEEYPVIPEVETGSGFSFDAVSLRKGLNQVLPAVAKNDIRPELSGMYFGFNKEKGKLTLAATDSYRLAEKKIVLNQGDEEKEIIVPGRTVQEISRILSLVIEVEEEKNVRLLVSDNQININYGGVQLISRLVDGSYPDYKQIIPGSFKTTSEFNTTQLVKEIKAASLFTTIGVNAISLDLNVAEGTTGVSSTSTQTGEYMSEINSDVSGEENSILLNHRYLLDGLNNLSTETATLEVINADSPCALKPKGDDSYVYIVMPIRQ